jgi:hypothetical protein
MGSYPVVAEKLPTLYSSNSVIYLHVDGYTAEEIQVHLAVYMQSISHLQTTGKYTYTNEGNPDWVNDTVLSFMYQITSTTSHAISLDILYRPDLLPTYLFKVWNEGP